MNKTIKKALFVIDVQPDFIDGALANPRAAKKVQNIVAKIKVRNFLFRIALS